MGKGPVSFDDIWPQERDFISRPERYKYVRKLIKPDGCVFCNAAKKEEEEGSLVLFNSDQVLVVLNKYPYNNGHLLVLPKRHIGNLQDLPDDEYSEILLMVKKAAAILEEAYQCEGINIGMNHGGAAGAGIPDHLHWHLVPRWTGDTNFFPVIAETKVLPESTEQSYEKLRPLFQKLIKG